MQHQRIITEQPPQVQHLLQLEREYNELKDKYEVLTRNYEQELEFHDLTSRTLRNNHMSAAYRLLYISLIDVYPATLNCLETPIQVHEIRYAAGGISEASATKFLQDLQSIGACEYDPGNYNPKTEERQGKLTGNPDKFPYPEYFDTRNTERAKKARETEKSKRELYREAVLVLQCERCTSPDIEYGLLPKCKACGYVHKGTTLPVAQLSVEPPEENEQEFIPQQKRTNPVTPVPDYEDLPDFIETIKLPHCQNWQCLTGPNMTQPRKFGAVIDFYCPVHRGYINERGLPI